jgi:hypothetical protein
MSPNPWGKFFKVDIPINQRKLRHLAKFLPILKENLQQKGSEFVHLLIYVIENISQQFSISKGMKSQYTKGFQDALTIIVARKHYC